MATTRDVQCVGATMTTVLHLVLFTSSLLGVLRPGCAQSLSAREGDWNAATATFFDAPQELSQRVAHEFGTLYTGACGFTNQAVDTPKRGNADLTFPKEMNAALGSFNPEYLGGVCGRCYEVRCRTGYTEKDYNSSGPANVVPSLGTPFADTVPDFKDPKGRSYPGDFGDRHRAVGARCWNDTSSGSIVVRITDVCPCNRPASQGGYNPPCCGPAAHLDLSYWAFSELAHPLYGNMAVLYRPVDCVTHQPLSQLGVTSPSGILGGASSRIIGNGIQPGWAITQDNMTWANLSQPIGGGRNATCATLQSGGSLGWHCFPGCKDLFTGTVRLTVRPAQRITGYPATYNNGTALPLKVIISRSFINETDVVGQAQCAQTPALNNVSSSDKGDGQGSKSYSFPFTSFDCGSRNVSQSNANTVLVQNYGTGSVTFCVIELTV